MQREKERGSGRKEGGMEGDKQTGRVKQGGKKDEKERQGRKG